MSDSYGPGFAPGYRQCVLPDLIALPCHLLNTLSTDSYVFMTQN